MNITEFMSGHGHEFKPDLHIVHFVESREKVLEIVFDRVCSVRSETLPISKDFYLKWLILPFFMIFVN